MGSVAPDYVIGVVGTKGCGKSTFIRLALQAVDPEESRIVAASADGPTITRKPIANTGAFYIRLNRAHRVLFQSPAPPSPAAPPESSR